MGLIGTSGEFQPGPCVVSKWNYPWLSVEDVCIFFMLLSLPAAAAAADAGAMTMKMRTLGWVLK